MNNIKMDLKEIRRDGVRWIHVTQDTNMWQALAYVKMNLQAQSNMGNFLKSSELLASQEELCSSELLSIYVT